MKNANTTYKPYIQAALGDRTKAKLSEDKEKNDKIIAYFAKDIFRISKTNVSYKQANDLDKAGLLPAKRADNAENGWRLFNFKDCLYLDLLMFIKKYGMANKKLEAMKDLFYGDKINDLLLACGYGIEITLLIYDDGNGYAFDPERLIENENDRRIVWANGDMHLRIHLNYYFNQVLKSDDRIPVRTHRSLSLIAWRVLETEDDLSENERRILIAVRDSDAQEIVINMRDGKPSTIRPQNTSQHSTEKDVIEGIRQLRFGDITVKKRNGKVVLYQKGATEKLD
jgi:DNA-binding transcriptional MerR regulator